MADLHGRVVAFLEARRAAELADLIARHHGTPLAAPCLREVHHPDAPELAEAVDRLCDDAVTVAIFLTGVGTATIVEAARLHGRTEELLAALATKRVAARGPKPVAVLRKAGVRIDLVAPPPNTYGDSGRGILYGPGHTNFDTSLSKRFAVGGRANAEFRWDVFNLFNHPGFGFPNAAIGNATVGRISTTIVDNRSMQFALKVNF